jgi:hypothetical protein
MVSLPAMLSSLRSTATAVLALFAAAALPAAAQSASPMQQPVGSRNAPVMVAGLWCGTGLLHKYALDIAQEYQYVHGRLTRGDRGYDLTGHMDGPVLRADPQRNHTMDLRAEGNELRIIDASGILALTKGMFFTRASGGSCSN